MKKVMLGILTMFIVFSSMAQTSDKPAENQRLHKEHKGLKEHKFKDLNLKDDQKTRLKTVKESFKQKMNDIAKNGGTETEQKQKRKALKQQRRQEMMAILTPEQQKKAGEFRKEHKDKEHKKLRGKEGSETVK